MKKGSERRVSWGSSCREGSDGGKVGDDFRAGKGRKGSKGGKKGK